MILANSLYKLRSLSIKILSPSSLFDNGAGRVYAKSNYASKKCKCISFSDFNNKQVIVNLFLILIMIGLYILPLSLFALPSDAQQKMYITSTSSIVNLKTGINTFIGNVKVDQGTSHLRSDLLKTYRGKDKQIDKAIAYGSEYGKTTSLAKYQTTPNPGDNPVHAKAKTIIFYPAKNQAILIGDGEATQGDNTYTGPRITYDFTNEVVTSPYSDEGRTRIFIDQDGAGATKSSKTQSTSGQ